MKEWFARQLTQQLEVNPLAAFVFVTLASVLSGFLGRLLWAGVAVKVWDWWMYGGWKVVVSGGASGRHWHAPLDKEIVRHLRDKNYFAFKRDLGTVVSGEGILHFSFGVPVGEAVKRRVPEAPGLTVDRNTKTITIDFTKAKAS